MTGSVPRPESVLGLRDLGRDDLAAAGGKGANLGELIRASCRVPDGFVVTTSAYLEALAGLDNDDLLGPDSVEVAASRIRARLESAPLPPALQTDINRAHAELGGGSVAVRSSATAEDLPGAAFAGQQDSYLNITTPVELLNAIRRCWASLWTDRAISYRNRRGIDHREVSIAVVVQQMIESDFAGVMFTANPVTGRRGETVIESSPGLGEAVVAGLVTPDHAVVGNAGVITERRAGTREVIIRGNPAGGVVRTYSPDDGVDPIVLPDSVLLELSELGSRIARHFGRPQDIEWAQAGRSLWILQARPLTALPPEPLPVNPLRRAMAALVAELVPIRPYPLDMTAWTIPGHGRILTRMAAEMPAVAIDLHAMLPEVDGVVDRLVPPSPRPTLRTLTTPFRLRTKVARYLPERWTADPRFADFERGIELLNSEDHTTMAWAELIMVPRRALAALDSFISLRIDYLPRAGVDLARLRLQLALLGLGRHFAALVLGARTRTWQADQALQDLARQVAADPVAGAAFRSSDVAAVAAAVDNDPRLAQLARSLQAFLAEYGHRETTSVLLISAPSWSDDPGLLIGAVKAAGGATPGDQRAAVQAAEDAVRSSRRARLVGGGDKVLRLARSAQAGLAFREDSHFYASKPRPIIRNALIEAGRRLVEVDLLEQPESIFHLRLEEVEAIADPAGIDPADAARLRTAVRRRSRRRDELAGSPLISPATLYRRRRSDRDALVSGVPAGGGTATGTVRVIRDPGEFDRLLPGEILVCPYTNPSCTPLFRTAVAVVVDTGSLGSHAAIVAREYGIPAIMATGNGTAVLRDGQTVTVDGRRGTVAAAPA